MATDWMQLTKELALTGAVGAGVGALIDMTGVGVPARNRVASAASAGGAVMVGELAHYLTDSYSSSFVAEGLAPLMAPALTAATTVAMDKFTQYGVPNRSLTEGVMRGAITDLTARYIVPQYFLDKNSTVLFKN